MTENLTPMSFLDRLEESRRGEGECWDWTGSKDRKGYGLTHIPGAKSVKRAHRISYELAKGEIPPGMEIDHICHNRSCVNPAHLQAVTSKENQENRAGAYRNSKSGVRGVHWHVAHHKWQATVRHYGKKIHVGYFDTIEEAEAAVIAKRLELHTNNLIDRQLVTIAR